MIESWIAIGLLAIMVFGGWLIGRNERIWKGGVNTSPPPDAIPPPPPPSQRRPYVITGRCGCGTHHKSKPGEGIACEGCGMRIENRDSATQPAISKRCQG
jgi:hypothetical protein